MTKLKTIGKRETRLNACKLESNYLKSRAKKPYRTSIKKCGKKWCVKVQEKKE